MNTDNFTGLAIEGEGKGWRVSVYDDGKRVTSEFAARSGQGADKDLQAATQRMLKYLD